MVYCSTSDEFIRLSCNLFSLHPDRTRYTVKYRSSNKQYTFKVTDDYTLIKLKLNRSNHIKSIQLIHQILLQLCIEKEIDQTIIDKLIQLNTQAMTQSMNNNETNINTGKQRNKQQQQQQNKKKGKK